MRIQHNIAALNSHRQLTNNNNAVAKNLEKLSSGYRINRAGDDAAGLAISEKMRAQITGLDTASKNAQDGISLVQTAEGALTEVHSMLNRMAELADQSANGTYQDLVDRANIQKELDSLRDEADRISQGTNFNGIKLLDGSMGGAKVTSTKGIPASGGAPATKASFDVDIDALVTGGVGNGETLEIGTITAADGTGTAGKFSIDLKATIGAALAATDSIYIGDKKIDGTAGTAAVGDDGVVSFTATKGASDITTDEATIRGEFKKGTTAGNAAGAAEIAGTALTGITEGTDAGALGKAATLAAITTAIAGKEITVDGEVYTAALNGTKLTFTAKDAGLLTPDKVNIAAAITNNGTAVDEAKIDNVKAGEIAKPDTNPAVNATGSISFSTLPKAGDTIKIGDVTYEFVAKDGDAIKGNTNTAVTIGADTKITAANFHAKIGINTKIKEATVVGSKVTFSTADGVDSDKPVTVTQVAQGLTLQIGESSDSFNQLSVAVGSMGTEALGIDKASIDISTQEGAKAAIDKIKNAINLVSSTRGDLGAIQNRLEHTVNNLGVTSENMSAAESRIRDVDMAKEMMTFTKNNILTRASQAMLAQANQLPQGVLQLLQ